ncbi:hypothetical protein QTP70_030556 [Hemibagrus guttatus]|uniref:Uncharacterized protein n=1 Tax=Hemibagrus guttatus TaxID=175788 RepID=A0AAE0QIF8_9TELE|nr:hypothetical protein QTP70_030556 [Hemibagrus guttatus]KAK3553139.1 hypothetical protein QTP86_031725 [Hemibagrus guttatus]
MTKNKKKRIFFTGFEMEKKEVYREVKHAIKTAKLKYKEKMEQSFAEGNLHSAWQGLKNMAAMNTAPSTSRTIQLLFQISSTCSTVTKLWKHSTVISIPKKSSTIKALNDLRPVALTSLVMKAMERVVKNYIINKTDSLMDLYNLHIAPAGELMMPKYSS